jgi:heat shock protein HslJ
VNRATIVLAAGLVLVAAGLGACAPTAEPTTGAEATLPAATEAVAVSPTEMTTTTVGTTDALAGNWVLVSYGDAKTPTEVPAGVTVTAKFAAGQLSGNNGCNNYNATYTIDGSKLTIAPGASTMMACQDPQAQVEQAYMAALPLVTTFATAEGGLTLTYGNGQALVYKAGPSGLSGTSWEVTGYNNGKEAVVSLVTGSTISLDFVDGTVSGKACNNYNGAFTEDGTALTIGPLATTRMMCPEAGVMDQETAYLAALQAATVFSLDGSVLTLRDAKGATQVTANPAAAPASSGSAPAGTTAATTPESAPAASATP